MNEKDPHMQAGAWLFYSCNTDLRRVVEQFVYEHVFTHVLAGSLDFFIENEHRVFHAGDKLLVKRNQLAKVVKIPPPGGQFKSISLYLNQDILRAYSLEYGVKAAGSYQGEGIIRLKEDAFYESFADSLIPYVSTDGGQTDPALSQLKVKEAIMLLLQLEKKARDLLFDFGEPGKNDLV